MIVELKLEVQVVVLLNQIKILCSILNVQYLALQRLICMLDDFVDKCALLRHMSSI
jgi:hypothetical protein